MARVIAGHAGARSDARRRRALDARAHAARSADAARQDDSGGQAARRNAAPAVHPRARARLPRRPRAGAHDRLRLVPEPVRPGARRSARRGAAARPRAPLDCRPSKTDTGRSAAAARRCRACTLESGSPAHLAEALGAVAAALALAIPVVLLCHRRHLLLRPLRAADRRAAARRARSTFPARASRGRSNCGAASR